TLFGVFRLFRFPLNDVPFTSPEKLSPTRGHGFSFLKLSGIVTLLSFLPSTEVLLTVFPPRVALPTTESLPDGMLETFTCILTLLHLFDFDFRGPLVFRVPFSCATLAARAGDATSITVTESAAKITIIVCFFVSIIDFKMKNIEYK